MKSRKNRQINSTLLRVDLQTFARIRQMSEIEDRPMIRVIRRIIEEYAAQVAPDLSQSGNGAAVRHGDG